MSGKVRSSYSDCDEGQNTTYQSAVERWREVFEAQPDVEGAVRRERHFQAHALEPLQDEVTLGLEVPLKRSLIVAVSVHMVTSFQDHLPFPSGHERGPVRG